MSKKERVKISNCRQKIAKEYSDRLNSLRIDNKRLYDENLQHRVTISQLEDELRRLKESNERLLEYMDLTDEDFNNLKKQSSLLKDLQSNCGQSFNLLFSNELTKSLFSHML